MTHTYFQSVRDSRRSFSASTKPGSERKLCLPNHITVRDADWFKCHFRQLYFKADWSEILSCQLPFYRFVFTSAENTTLLPGLHVRRKSRQQSLMKILSLGEREVLKQVRSSPGEIKRREVSWTLTKKLVQKRSRSGRWCWAGGRESWTSFASVVSQRRSYGHCLCDSILHSSWDSNCVVRWSLRSAGRTLP